LEGDGKAMGDIDNKMKNIDQAKSFQESKDGEAHQSNPHLSL
jgi:hypothetical protein